MTSIGLPIFDRQAFEGVTGGGGLAAVPENGLFETTGAAVVEEQTVPVHRFDQPDSPERCGSPFGSAGRVFAKRIGEPFAHIV